MDNVVETVEFEISQSRREDLTTESDGVVVGLVEFVRSSY
jgi:hypothetical protein